MRNPLLVLPLAAYCLWGGWDWWAHRPMHPADGVIAADDPRQSDVTAGARVKVGRWMLTMRAGYVITARVLSRESYRFDALSDLVPEDLALGWGPMSDNRVLRTMDISQANRFYFWRAPHGAPIGKDAIITHSANTHVIPASRAVARQLASLRPGQVVTLSGELVDGVRDDGMSIKTSLVRYDTGAGACEVMLVDDVTT
jgi:hypothetical protein